MNLLLLYEYNLFTHEQYLYSKVINIFTVYFLLVYPSIHLINLLYTQTIKITIHIKRGLSLHGLSPLIILIIIT